MGPEANQPLITENPTRNQLAAEAAGVAIRTDRADRQYAVDVATGKRIPVEQAEHRIARENIAAGALALGAVTAEQANEEAAAHRAVVFDPADHKRSSYLDRRDRKENDKAPSVDIGARLVKVQDAAAKKKEFAKKDDEWMAKKAEQAGKLDD